MHCIGLNSVGAVGLSEPLFVNAFKSVINLKLLHPWKELEFKPQVYRRVNCRAGLLPRHIKQRTKYNKDFLLMQTGK